MWNLHVLAETYHQRPSQILSIPDDWAAYQFDMAVMRLSQYVQAQLDKKRSLRAILDEPIDKPGGPGGLGQYADVRQLGPIRTVQLDESGIW